MSIKTATNRFIVSPLPVLRIGLYQHILGSVVSFQELGNRLTYYAQHAQTIRQVEQVQEAGQLLVNLPLKEYQAIGQYYLAWCNYRNNVNQREAFENVAEYAPTLYRIRALQSLAAIEARKQDYSSELYWLMESMKVHPSIEALRGIAIVKSKEGYHHSAVKDFEQLYTLAQHSWPVSYLQYLNSFAVELGEVGRIEEAKNVCRITLASPFIFAYPEWRETWQELALRGYKSRSVVSVPELPLKVKDNVVPIPANTNPSPTKKGRGKVLDLQKLRKKMVKEPNGENEDIKNMDEKDLFLKLMQLSTQDDITRKKLLKLVEYAIKVVSEPD